MSLGGKEIILGITGSIAAYKAVLLLRELTAGGAAVSVVMTAGAEHFVGPLTFRTLSGRPVLTNLFDPQSDEAVEHVALAERAHAFVVAPATANVLAKAAHGIADDFLTTLLLAARCPVLMAPAMDGGMWDHAAVRANVATLRERGVTILEPDAGAPGGGAARAACRRSRPSSKKSSACSHPAATWPASACSSPPGRPASLSIPCATSRTDPRARWATPWRPRRSGAARRSC